MASEETPQEVGDAAVDIPKPPTAPAAMVTANKKRPRLDLTVGEGARERKRGKSMFGLLVGTLNKAKIEDKERNASEAAKKRQLIDQRLQNKLRRETDSVRRAEEAKKDKTSANRKEEELQLKDSIHKLRRTRLPLLANFLLTSDVIIPSDSSTPPTKDPLSLAPRTHPPPLYYLPAILTPAQEAFLRQRKAEVTDAVEKEWAAFREERAVGIEEITQLRKRVAEEQARKRTETTEENEENQETDKPMVTDDAPPPAPEPKIDDVAPSHDIEMEVDEAVAAPEAKNDEKEDKKEDVAPMRADDDDAVEY